MYCDKTDQNGVGLAVVSHDSESRTLLDGYEGKSTYERHVHYIALGLTMLHNLQAFPLPPLTVNSLSCMNASIVLFSSMVTNLAGGCHATPRT